MYPEIEKKMRRAQNKAHAGGASTLP